MYRKFCLAWMLQIKHKILLFLFIKLQDNQRWFRMTHYNVQLILRTKHAERLKIIYGSKLPEKKISSILGEYLTSYLCIFYFAFFFKDSFKYLPPLLAAMACVSIEEASQIPEKIIENRSDIPLLALLPQLILESELLAVFFFETFIA